MSKEDLQAECKNRGIALTAPESHALGTSVKQKTRAQTFLDIRYRVQIMMFQEAEQRRQAFTVLTEENLEEMSVDQTASGSAPGSSRGGE